jgi:S1-C subfamily serine protease
VGSLLVQEKIDAGTLQGNMIVPIDLLEPILADLLRLGRPDRPPRPWLGLYATEAGEKLVVAGLAPRGPAERAGVQVGDILVEASGAKPSSLADFFRRVWSAGSAGAEVRLKVVREGKLTDVRIVSADRNDFLKKPHLH